jgi:hypothetical protein
MNARSLLLSCTAVLATLALAQSVAPPAVPAVVGKASHVQGLVTVSSGTLVGSVGDDTPIFDGSRIVTGSAGSLSLDFSDGCVVEVAPNQATTIDAAAPCPERQKGVFALLGDTVVVASAPGATYAPLAGLGYIASGALINSTIVATPIGAGGLPPGGGGLPGGGVPDPLPSGQ